MDYSIILDFARQKNVRRWNGRKTLSEFNLLEHAGRVANICRTIMSGVNLSESVKLHVMEYALLHDYPEVWLNDTPSPIKARYPALDELLKSIESEILQPLELELSSLVKWIVKLADVLDCLYESLIELKLGVECAEFSSVVNNAQTTLFLSARRYGLVVDGDDVLRQLLNNALTLHDYLITALGKES